MLPWIRNLYAISIGHAIHLKVEEPTLQKLSQQITKWLDWRYTWHTLISYPDLTLFPVTE